MVKNTLQGSAAALWTKVSVNWGNGILESTAITKGTHYIIQYIAQDENMDYRKHPYYLLYVASSV